MEELKKMIQAVINGQSALKSELLLEIKKNRRDIDKLRGELKGDLKDLEKRLTKRIDKLGSQIAYLEDDTPTREEFDELKDKVLQFKG